jgi:hypothetical protein
VYVPVIVRAIMADPRGINLKGFAVGDGCMGTEVLCGGGSGPYWDVEFMHGHGQVSNRYTARVIGAVLREEGTLQLSLSHRAARNRKACGLQAHLPPSPFFLPSALQALPRHCQDLP